MIIFFILGFASKKIKDRYLLLIVLLCNMSTLIFLIVYLPTQRPCLDAPAFKDYALFMLPVFGNVPSLPLIVLGSISLLSKITNIETQGLTQGIRRTVVGIACIMGPIWSGNEKAILLYFHNHIISNRCCYQRYLLRTMVHIDRLTNRHSKSIIDYDIALV